MRKSIFPSAKEALPVIVITVLFLSLTAACIGLRAEHFLMTGLFVVLFFAGKTTRKLAVALLPFIIFGISYDWMRVYPNYQVMCRGCMRRRSHCSGSRLAEQR